MNIKGKVHKKPHDEENSNGYYFVLNYFISIS